MRHIDRTELCQEVGISIDTWNSWKKQGLIPLPVSKNGRTLLYSRSVAERLKHILKMQKQGESLQRIADFFKKQERQTAIEHYSDSQEDLESAYKAIHEKWKANDKKLACEALELDPALVGDFYCYATQEIIGFHKETKMWKSIPTETITFNIVLRYKGSVYVAEIEDGLEMDFPVCVSNEILSINEFCFAALLACRGNEKTLPNLDEVCRYIHAYEHWRQDVNDMIKRQKLGADIADYMADKAN